MHPVTKEVERQHHKHDCQPWTDRDPPRLIKHIASFGHQVSPRGGRGGIPAPRKLNADSTTIPQPTWSVASTTTLLKMLGRIWTAIMRRVGDPATFAKAMKSRSFTLSTCPRTRRAYWAHRSKARMATTMPKLAPMVTTNTSATRMAGNDIIMSTLRMMRASTQPPR